MTATAAEERAKARAFIDEVGRRLSEPDLMDRALGEAPTRATVVADVLEALDAYVEAVVIDHGSDDPVDGQLRSEARQRLHRAVQEAWR